MPSVCEWKIEWRWLKVPLPESCPESRTGKPSSSKVANANCSAVVQSKPFPVRNIFFLFSLIFFIFGWTSNSCGMTVSFSPISFILSSDTPVIPLLSFPFSGLNLDQMPSYHSSFGLYCFAVWNCSSKRFLNSIFILLNSSWVIVSSLISLFP